MKNITIKSILIESVLQNLYFWIFSSISLCLLIASFIIPPKGVIDPSVLAGVGEIMGLIAFGTVIKAIDKGTSATVKHKDTQIEVKGKE